MRRCSLCSAKARKERLESEFIVTIPYFLWSAAICKGFELLKMSNIQQFRHMVPESEAFWKSSQIHFYAELVCLAKPSSLFGTLNRELGCTKRFYREMAFRFPMRVAMTKHYQSIIYGITA